MHRHRIAPATLASHVLRNFGAPDHPACVLSQPSGPIRLKNEPSHAVKLNKSEHVHMGVLQVLHAGRIDMITQPADLWPEAPPREPFPCDTPLT